MSVWIAVAAGGALGASLRFWLASSMNRAFGGLFPYGTLAVNVMGCALIGFIYILAMERWGIGPVLRSGILIGLLGGFTTYSAFTLETLLMVENGYFGRACINVGLTTLLCIGATWFGMLAARQL